MAVLEATTFPAENVDNGKLVCKKAKRAKNCRGPCHCFCGGDPDRGFRCDGDDNPNCGSTSECYTNCMCVPFNALLGRAADVAGMF